MLGEVIFLFLTDSGFHTHSVPGQVLLLLNFFIHMITLSDEAVKEYQRIWKDDFQRDLPDEDAREEAERFLDFMRPFMMQSLN